MTSRIVVIDPATGKILREIEASELVAKGQGPTQDVLNGIAYNSETQKTYLTGKKWLALFEVKFVKN
jgi:glutaminyl-peptide cyclotransferase